MPATLEPETRGPRSSILDDPARFKTAPSTLAVDRFMTRFIKVGGISLIAAVFAIFLFIFWQILPLFRHAKVEPLAVVEAPVGRYQAIGVDEWSELPFVIDASGRIVFVPVQDPASAEAPAIPFESPKDISAFHYDPVGQTVAYGSEDGSFSWLKIGYEADFESGRRVVKHDLTASPWFAAGDKPWPVRALDFGDSGDEKLAAFIQEQDGVRRVEAILFGQEQTLFGAGEIRMEGRFDLTGRIPSKPVQVLVNSTADGILVAGEGGQVYYFHRAEETFELRQTFSPFEDAADPKIASMSFLLGDGSLIFTNHEGLNRMFSLYMPAGTESRLFGKTKEFRKLESGAEFFAPSLRNKAFLVGSGTQASLRYATTADVRWEGRLPFRAKTATLSGKFERILFLDQDGRIHIYRLDDPHPEASFNAFFGKVWYEGASEPRYEWQSSGASDDFEPKLSMVPLMIGTLKGTLYAMFFALPIALLAAMYTSQFLASRIRAFAKPTMEIMASLPSVVLGFLAALWLAPLIEKKVPSILLMCVVIPASACGMGLLFQQLPVRARHWVRSGFEFVLLVPVLILAGWACWQAGPALERLLFTVTDPATGARVSDFRLWWPQVTGTSFEQRNSLAVGFMMGFAVIPIIFTIAEDSLSNVPEYLRSGSLALGASRWQTALFVVLPTAFPGIFSALMVGLGRAIGETMIVVMATGNTPIMDFNIFSGMRTLSANIAVELPEAPHHGTLYRALFLGALLLFITTFFVNTLAEILRQRIREKYRTA